MTARFFRASGVVVGPPQPDASVTSTITAAARGTMLRQRCRSLGRLLILVAVSWAVLLLDGPTAVASRGVG